MARQVALPLGQTQWQLPKSLARRHEYGVGNRSGDRRNARLADPPGASVLGTVWTSTTGASPIRSIGYVLKFCCSTRPSLIVISFLSAHVKP
jgi:hypothetical protein